MPLEKYQIPFRATKNYMFWRLGFVSLCFSTMKQTNKKVRYHEN